MQNKMASSMSGWFGSIFNPILNPIFGPLLKLHPFFAILIITLIVTLISIVAYKKLTDQALLKSIREEMKELRKKMDESKNDSKKLMELQKISMAKSMIQMKQTMKPMLITMIPILIIFGWFSTHLAYNPITPDQQFSVNLTLKENLGNVTIILPENIESLDSNTKTVENKKAGFLLKAKQEGKYSLTFDYNNKTYTKDILISNNKEYITPVEVVNQDIKTIMVSNAPIKIFGLGWLWVYIIMAVILNSLFRKLFKVY